MSRRPGCLVEDISEERFIPKSRDPLLRGINRLLSATHRKALYSEILNRASAFRPNVFIAYKGYPLDSNFIEALRQRGVFTVNVYPDCSPHAYGGSHRSAVGAYDLVVSTKSFHPDLWHTAYGYKNECVFVPQGYDPTLHLFDYPESKFQYDLVLAATWRAEYAKLMTGLIDVVRRHGLRVGVVGNGWRESRDPFPSNWSLLGARTGRSYVEFLRSGRVCIAPLTRTPAGNDSGLPGDEDSTRTYELPAAFCFFVHQRTDYVRRIFDEHSEVPMFSDSAELSSKILYALDNDALRMRMAAAAHHRAVPRDSIDLRAAEIASLLLERSELKLNSRRR